MQTPPLGTLGSTQGPLEALRGDRRAPCARGVPGFGGGRGRVGGVPVFGLVLGFLALLPLPRFLPRGRARAHLLGWLL